MEFLLSAHLQSHSGLVFKWCIQNNMWLLNKDENINVDFYYNGSAGGCMPFGLTHVRPPILDKGKHTFVCRNSMWSKIYQIKYAVMTTCE